MKKRLGNNVDVEIDLPFKCREIFNEFDADGSGRIDIDEVISAMSVLGVEVSTTLQYES